MDVFQLKIYIAILSTLCLTFFILVLKRYYLHKQETLILNFTKKFDDYTDIKKMAFLFVQEVKNLLNADLVAVIEYSQNKTEIINSIPTQNSDKISAAANELYLILRNLEQENIKHIENGDIQSEYFKKIFPVFSYEYYHICPIFTDNSRIITLEIYGDSGVNFKFKKKVLKELISIFKKIFIQQNKFQKKIFKIKKNEAVIKFLDRIRNTLDKNELEQIILEEICHAFQCDRAYFISAYKNDIQSPVLGKEYLANPYVTSLKGNNLDFTSVWEQMKENKTNPPVFVIEDSEKFLKQNNLADTPIGEFIKKSQIKSSYPFLVYEDDNILSYLVLQYTKQVFPFDKYDFEIMDLMVKQTKIALTQANLHTQLIINSKKEKLLIDSISILRSSLDIKNVSNEFVGKVGIFFNADRCSIRFYDSKSKKFSGYDEAFEYKKHYYTASAKNVDLQNESNDFLMQNEKFHDAFMIQYETDLHNENFEYRENLKEYADKHKIKSYLASYIRYNGKLLGLLSLHFKEKRSLNESDESFIKALADQVGIAIYQSELYSNIQSSAKKEKLLKEVYADTISLQNKKEIYTYFSEKITGLFGCAGCVFIDFPISTTDKIEYFENYKTQNINLSKFKNYSFINELVNKKILNYNCNLKNENEEFNEFLKDTGLICIATIPISDNSLMILFFNNKKEFSSFDKNILFALIDVIARCIKDSLKNAEIKSLKEGFLSTLTHDLQIPLIAERNAINYLINKNELCNDKSVKEILKELKETNSQTEDMLKVLTSVYKYEANKKILNREDCNILTIIDESLSRMPKKFFDKNISLKKEVNTENLHFFADYNEIIKVVVIILTNLSDSSEKESEINVNISDDGKFLKCCFSGYGDTQEYNLNSRIFPRDMTTNSLEHRIGEGIYLYLAKLIISKHSGKIYINNKSDGGKIFCIELEKIV